MSVTKTKENKTTNEILQTVSLDVIKVDEKSRLRATGDIIPLKDSIENIGVINPITVDTDYNIIAGFHRYLACKELNHREIPVRIVDKSINKELLEIDENLIRNNLTTLETAQQLLKRKGIYETMYPDSKPENVKRNNFASVYTTKCFTKDVSERIDKSQRWVQSHIKIADNLTPESVQKIKGTELENNFILLQNISRKEPKEQLKAIESFLSTEKKPKLPKQLSTKYKVDFARRMVVVDNQWVQLPDDYDIESNSYNQMVEDLKKLIEKS